MCNCKARNHLRIIVFKGRASFLVFSFSFIFLKFFPYFGLIYLFNFFLVFLSPPQSLATQETTHFIPLLCPFSEEQRCQPLRTLSAETRSGFVPKLQPLRNAARGPVLQCCRRVQSPSPQQGEAARSSGPTLPAGEESPGACGATGDRIRGELCCHLQRG